MPVLHVRSMKELPLLIISASKPGGLSMIHTQAIFL
jgi:hypothetical protein